MHEAVSTRDSLFLFLLRRAVPIASADKTAGEIFETVFKQITVLPAMKWQNMNNPRRQPGAE
jgi:hypothetical protein